MHNIYDASITVTLQQWSTLKQ